MGRDWQARSERYYDTVGEIWYASQFYGRISKIDWFVEKQAADGTWQRLETPSGADAAIVAEWERIQDANGGVGSLFGAMGRLRFLVGEYWLVVRWDNDRATGKVVETWEVRDRHEVKVTEGSGGQTIKLGPDGKGAEYKVWETPWQQAPGEAFAWRMWRPHPVRSNEGDAPMRAVLDLCEELLLLRRAIRARARSRIPAGVALLPREAFPGNVPRDNEADPMKNPVTKRLVESLITPLSDESDPASLVPTFLWVGQEFIDKFVTWQMSANEKGAAGYPESRIRDELVVSIARGLDFPMEYLTGQGSSNHWTGWLIDDQMWKGHLQPVTQDIADDFTSVVLRPRWQAFTQTPEGYRLGYDPHALIVRPDRAKDSKDLYTLGVIGGEAVREANAFDEDDAPDEQERLDMLDFVGKARIATGDAASTTDTQSPPVQASASGPLMWLDGAAAIAGLRCRELAGQRLKNLLRKHDPVLAEQYVDCPAHDLAATLGRDLTIVVTRTERPEQQLVHGGTATLAASLHGLSADTATAVCEAVERNAAKGLYDLAGV